MPHEALCESQAFLSSVMVLVEKEASSRGIGFAIRPKELPVPSRICRHFINKLGEFFGVSEPAGRKLSSQGSEALLAKRSMEHRSVVRAGRDDIQAHAALGEQAVEGPEVMERSHGGAIGVVELASRQTGDRGPHDDAASLIDALIHPLEELERASDIFLE